MPKSLYLIELIKECGWGRTVIYYEKKELERLKTFEKKDDWYRAATQYHFYIAGKSLCQRICSTSSGEIRPNHSEENRNNCQTCRYLARVIIAEKMILKVKKKTVKSFILSDNTKIKVSPLKELTERHYLSRESYL